MAPLGVSTNMFILCLKGTEYYKKIIVIIDSNSKHSNPSSNRSGCAVCFVPPSDSASPYRSSLCIVLAGLAGTGLLLRLLHQPPHVGPGAEVAGGHVRPALPVGSHLQCSVSV